MQSSCPYSTQVLQPIAFREVDADGRPFNIELQLTIITRDVKFPDSIKAETRLFRSVGIAGASQMFPTGDARHRTCGVFSSITGGLCEMTTEMVYLTPSDKVPVWSLTRPTGQKVHTHVVLSVCV